MNTRGLTVAELVVVLLIIGILTAIAVPLYLSAFTAKTTVVPLPDTIVLLSASGPFAVYCDTDRGHLLYRNRYSGKGFAVVPDGCAK